MSSIAARMHRSVGLEFFDIGLVLSIGLGYLMLGGVGWDDRVHSWVGRNVEIMACERACCIEQARG